MKRASAWNSSALRRDRARRARRVAGQQRGDLRGRVVDEAEGDLVQLDHTGVAVVLGPSPGSPSSLLPGRRRLEGPGADRLGRRRRRALRVEDHGGVLAHAERKLTVGVVERRITVLLIRAWRDRGDVVEHRLLRLVGRAAGLGALKVSLRRWNQGFAILELHALLQLEECNLPSGSMVQRLGQQRHHVPSMLILVRPSRML